MRHLIVNTQTGEAIEAPVTDEWVLANRSKEVELSAGALQVALNANTLVSIQLYSPPLADSNRQTLNENLTAEIQFGDKAVMVSIVNGVWSDNVQFVKAGTHIIKCLSHPSNSLSIEVA